MRQIIGDRYATELMFTGEFVETQQSRKMGLIDDVFQPEDLEENLKGLDNLGGPEYFNHFAWGWTWAGNTPFRRWKRETYRGGISDPFIVHYPKGIQAKGEVRAQFTHAIDMVPTVLDLLDLEPPTSIAVGALFVGSPSRMAQSPAMPPTWTS